MVDDKYWDDMLKDMWVRQAHQQIGFKLDPRNMSSLERIETAKDLLLGMHEEVQELSKNITPYKHRILKIHPIEKDNVVEEVVDVLKYLLAIAQLHHITPEEVYHRFVQKTQVVAEKARAKEIELIRETKVIVSDLDGCIVDFSAFQARLANVRGDGVMDQKMVEVLKSLKADYYKDGGFRQVPIMVGAKDALRTIKQAGYKLVIITARPYWQHKRLYGDTIYWLKKHDIEYDLLLFNKDKSEAICEHLFPAKPEFFIEDRDKHALELVNIGVKVLLLDSEHNRTLLEHPLIRRVGDWDEIAQIICGE